MKYRPEGDSKQRHAVFHTPLIIALGLTTQPGFLNYQMDVIISLYIYEPKP